jgi:ElaB/YqjD/DUF883 family membrane-anchored ribosome-binding protein
MNTFNPQDLSAPPASGHDADAMLEAGKDHAAQAARELKEAAVLKAQEVKENAVHRAEDVRRQVENKVQDMRSLCEARTREDPVRCLLYAFGAGFILGFIYRGR